MYRLKLHEILQAKKEELTSKYPKLISVETSIQLEKENKETGRDEKLEIPIIKTKFQIIIGLRRSMLRLDFPHLELIAHCH